MLSLHHSPPPCFSPHVSACARARACDARGGGQPPATAHPAKQYQSSRQLRVASYVCSSQCGRLLCADMSPLYPRTVPMFTHPSGQPNKGVVDQSGRNIIAGRDSREVIPASCLSFYASAPATLFRSLLHLSAPAAPCSTYQVALAPALRTSHSLHLHPAPCNPTPPTESRPHVPPVDTTQDPGMHLQVRSPARYRTTDTVRLLWILCRLDMGLVGPMPWTEPGRARPSPLRDNHDLPCPDLPFIGLCHCDSPVGPRTSRKHHGQPAIHPSIHPSTVHCDGHPPLRGAGHLDAGNQPTNCCPA